MSNICQNNFNFTKFCQIIVHILSKNFDYCPRFVLRIFTSPNFVHLLKEVDKTWTNVCPIFVQVLYNRNLGQKDKISCPTFVHYLSNSDIENVFSNCSNTFVRYLSKICPTFIQHWSNFCPKFVLILFDQSFYRSNAQPWQCQIHQFYHDHHL